MAHPIFYRLAACVNTADGVLRLHECSAEGATVEQSVAALGAKVAGPVFWSLYAYFQDAPSEWLADGETAADCVHYWETETGLPGEAVKFTPDAKYIDLPVNDPVQVGVTVAAVLALTPEQFVARVAANVKQKTWLNETVQVNGEPVGIKAYGLWVQRLTYKGLSDGAEFHTQKALKQWLLSALQWGAQ